MSLFDNKPFDSHSKHATGSTASGEILSIWMRNTLLIQSVGCTPKTYQADVPEGPIQIPFQIVCRTVDWLTGAGSRVPAPATPSVYIPPPVNPSRHHHLPEIWGSTVSAAQSGVIAPCLSR